MSADPPVGASSTDKESQPPGVAEYLKADHELIKGLFSAALTATPEQRGERFCDLMHKLVAHEVAEEEIVFPELHHLVGGGGIADELVEEQADAVKALAELEQLEPESEEFLLKLEGLRDDVLEHASREENEALPLLARFDPPEFLVGLGERYVSAMEHAPTHPHVHEPHNAPAIAVLGPVTALFDRMRHRLGAP